MRAVVQRVKEASVSVSDKIISSIRTGLLVFIGIEKGDGDTDIEYISRKLANLRIFPDENGVMNKTLAHYKGSLLIVSQFTLLGDVRKGNRPSYYSAMCPEDASIIFKHLVDRLRGEGLKVLTGRFRSMMDISLINDGPVTILLDSRKKF